MCKEFLKSLVDLKGICLVFAIVQSLECNSSKSKVGTTLFGISVSCHIPTKEKP